MGLLFGEWRYVAMRSRKVRRKGFGLPAGAVVGTISQVIVVTTDTIGHVQGALRIEVDRRATKDRMVRRAFDRRKRPDSVGLFTV